MVDSLSDQKIAKGPRSSLILAYGVVGKMVGFE